MRGYSFNVNSGAVESLELDSLGISVIPASLVSIPARRHRLRKFPFLPCRSSPDLSSVQVSTYCLMVEDVIEVAADCVVVEEDAESRLQRLTKVRGFLGFFSDRSRKRIDRASQPG